MPFDPAAVQPSSGFSAFAGPNFDLYVEGCAANLTNLFSSVFKRFRRRRRHYQSFRLAPGGYIRITERLHTGRSIAKNVKCKQWKKRLFLGLWSGRETAAYYKRTVEHIRPSWCVLERFEGSSASGAGEALEDSVTATRNAP
jgi:hypothetical protein